jgi:hypothetical protein
LVVEKVARARVGRGGAADAIGGAEVGAPGGGIGEPTTGAPLLEKLTLMMPVAGFEAIPEVA